MRPWRLLAVVLALALALAPGLAFARAGGGSSMGSRGSMTYSAPRSTTTAPGTAAPLQRSLTPQPTPGYAAAPARPGFMSGMLGGLLGAGLLGMLFGGGLFGSISGFGGFLGFLLQIFLVVMIGRFVWRMVASRRPAFAGAPFTPGMMPMGGPAPAPSQIQITPADFQAFEHLLQGVQAAWSEHDLAALRNLTTPEMVSYFADQLAQQASRGVRNIISDVRLEQGDLAEAWAEPGREFATVAMRFSMLDTTVDRTGRVIEGDVALRAQATELWTFLRTSGGAWLLSAIQQTG